MKIHTSTLTKGLLHNALTQAKHKAYQVDLYILSTHGSRSHKQAFDVALRGHGTRHTRPPQTRILADGVHERAATQDDWGYFMAEVFALDPDAQFGPYKNANDFHTQTKGRYKR